MRRVMQELRVSVCVIALLATPNAFAAATAVSAHKAAAGKTSSQKHLNQKPLATILAVDPDFKTFHQLLIAAGLSDRVDGTAGLSVLAPTEAAFAKLPEGTLDDWLKPENHEKLVAIVGYHLLPRKLALTQALQLGMLPTLAGDPLQVTIEDKQPLLDGARVLKANIEATNGMIHAIDTVLVPDGK
ncbi:MAG: fasciclin domain-containing protein [Lysobacteraceae bacterium]